MPLEVPHDSGIALLTMGMHLVDPFSMKRRSPLNQASRGILKPESLLVTISLSLFPNSLSVPISISPFSELVLCKIFCVSF